MGTHSSLGLHLGADHVLRQGLVGFPPRVLHRVGQVSPQCLLEGVNQSLAHVREEFRLDAVADVLRSCRNAR